MVSAISRVFLIDIIGDRMFIAAFSSLWDDLGTMGEFDRQEAIIIERWYMGFLRGGNLSGSPAGIFPGRLSRVRLSDLEWLL